MHTQRTTDMIIEQCDNLKSQPQVQQTSILALFRFTKPYDVFLMVVGSIAACLIGASLPLFCLFYGDMVNTFTNLDSMLDQAKRVFRSFIYLGVGALITGWIMMLFWTMAGERQSNQCRKQYFKSLLNQEIAWFDTHNQSQMAIQFSVNTHIYRSVLGQKIPILLLLISMFVTGVTIAFVKGWLMTLVVLVSIPFVIFGWYLFSKASKIRNSKLQELYEKGGSKVQQALSCIKVIKQLNGQSHQIASYSNLLDQAIEQTLKYRIYAGIGSGLGFTFILLAFTLAMWFGSQCVQGSSLCPASLSNGNSSYTPGAILVIFYGLLFPAVNLSQLTPAVQKMIQGKQASSKIFHIIDRKPSIISPVNPIQIKDFKGNFKFQRVTFNYPKDKFKRILENMSFQINCRSSAFIGESGCGKSTIFQLMMRFYDPNEGVITLDGIDLRQLDLCWLRSQIGYVGQEPVLFATSIRQNLLIGKSNARETELQDVLRKAQALDFVNTFSDKLDTFVGTDGSQLSGGQKQRIAIARALLKDPKILLMDQATSALDRHNQKLIQNTLNSISQNRVSITITHHLKTIEKCQAIFKVEKGRIVQDKRNHINRRIEPQMNRINDMVQKKEKKAMENEDNNNIYPIEGTLQKQKQKQIDQDAIQKSDIQKEDKTYQRLFGFVNNRLLFGVGIFLAVVSGVIFPLFGIFLSRIIVTLIQYYGNSVSSLADSNIYLLIMLLVSLVSFPICLFHEIIFTKIGEEITLQLRKKAFQKIVKMPIPWFQRKENSDGHIAASLQKDCLIVNGIFSTYMPHLIINISTLFFGIILALVYEWRTALVALGLLPLIIISQVVQMAYSNNLVQNADRSLKQSAGFIKEAIDNIRTVKSLAIQSVLLQKYSQKLESTLQQSVRKGHITGILFGFSYLVMFIVFALIFYLGAIFIRYYNVQVLDVFTAVYLIIFAGIAVGNNGSQMPDLAQARNAAANIFEILDGEDEDELQIKKGSLNLKQPIKGNISLQNISFKYENRQELALNNINLDIKEGEKIGLVGKSGSGKSTIIQLLLGFYHPTAGKILIDGINMTDYNIHHLRANFGVVSQEPILFNQTIEYNIKYNKENATKEDIVAAANQANLNPDKQDLQGYQANSSLDRIRGIGFNQNVGLKGTHISGGQKQRVAIARVIIREPSILLLDEATSALDESNQRKVQDSLDRLMSNKTCITVTHRMQTVKDANQIVVFDNGRVVEAGMYDELSKNNGFFTQFLRTSYSPIK